MATRTPAVFGASRLIRLTIALILLAGVASVSVNRADSVQLLEGIAVEAVTPVEVDTRWVTAAAADHHNQLRALADAAEAQERARRIASDRARATRSAKRVTKPAVTAPPDLQPAPQPADGEAWVAPEGCVVHGKKSVEETHRCWDGLLARFAWPVARMFSILRCESTGDPFAANASGARGLLQVLLLDKQKRPFGSFDPWTNMVQAKAKYDGARKAGGSGLGPWEQCL